MIEVSLPSQPEPELTEEQKAKQAADLETQKAVSSMVDMVFKRIKPAMKSRSKNDLILNIAQLMSELQILRQLVVSREQSKQKPE